MGSLNLVLVLYCLSWVCVLAYHLKKVRCFDVVSFIFLLNLLCGLCSLLIYEDSNNIGFVPSLYLFLCLFITTFPIRRVDISLKEIQPPSTFVIQSIALIIIVSGLIILPHVVISFSSGITKIMLESTAGASLYEEIASEAENAGGSVGSLPTIIFNAFSDLGILLFFYYLTLPKKKKWIIMGLFMGILLSIAQPISVGLRGGVIIVALTLIAAYLLFRKKYDHSVNSFFYFFYCIIVGLVSIPIFFITLSRFGDEASSSVIDYAGQAVINFNEHGLDANGIRYGDRVLPLFKKVIGISGVPNNYVERRDKYSSMTMDDSIFSTFVGDFTLDFGPVCGFLFCSLMSLVVYRVIKSKQTIIPFYKIIPLFFIICVCVQGAIYLFSYGDIGGNLKIVTYIIIYLFARRSYYERKSNSIISSAISSNTRK